MRGDCMKLENLIARSLSFYGKLLVQLVYDINVKIFMSFFFNSLQLIKMKTFPVIADNRNVYDLLVKCLSTYVMLAY